VSESIFDCSIFNLIKTSCLTARLFDRKLSNNGIKLSQYHFLCLILEREKENLISTIADRLGREKATIGKNMRILEKKGFIIIKKKQKKDNKANEKPRIEKIEITEAGIKAMSLSKEIYENLSVSTKSGTLLESLKEFSTRIKKISA